MKQKTKFKKTEIGIILKNWEVKEPNSLGKISTGNGTKKQIYDKYREICKKKGLLVSRQVEIMMDEQLKKERAEL